MLVYKFWETALNICKKSRDFMCRFLLNTKIRFINFKDNTKKRFKNFKENTKKSILFMPIINILVYIIAYFTGKSHIIFKRLAIGLFIVASIFNIYIFFENKKYFKYKVGNSSLHQLWLLLCNLSRSFVYFGILILFNSLLSPLISWWFRVPDMQKISNALANIIIVGFAFALVLRLVNFLTEGLMTGLRTITAIFILFLAGFSDIMMFFLGSAGAKLIIDWLFSDNYIEYIKLKMKDDVEIIDKIKEKLNSVKIKFTADFNFILFSLNLSMIIRKLIPPEQKFQVLYLTKWLLYRGAESIQDTPFVGRMLIGLVTIGVSVIWYFLLKYLFGKYLGKKILGIKSN